MMLGQLLAKALLLPVTGPFYHSVGVATERDVDFGVEKLASGNRRKEK